MEYIKLCLKGIGIGAANVMPGVSGATLAVIFRLYDSLIGAINKLFTDPKNSLKFIIPFGFGMVIGIILMGDIFNNLLVRFPLQASGLIAGLITGSIPFIHSEATSKNGKKTLYYVIAIVAAITIIALALLTPTPEPYTEAVFSLPFAIFLFFGGALAAAAMVIPGVSGAMILILFGLFSVVMHTITLIREYLMTPFDFSLLWSILMIAVPLGLGIVVGILVASKLIELMLNKFHSGTYFAILGLTFGSIFIMFNDVHSFENFDGATPMLIIYTSIAFILGSSLSLLLGKRKE